MTLQKYLLIILLLSFTGNFLNSQSRLTKGLNKKLDGSSGYVNTTTGKFNSLQIDLEGGKVTGDYVIGPEINVTGATGFYDYQTNGECKHFINRPGDGVLHAVFMTATDSMNIVDSRRVVYSYSTNEGVSWVYSGQVPPSIRSGFPTLTALAGGEAVICGHYLVTGSLRGVLAFDVAPMAGSFTFVNAPYNIAWPGGSRLSNGHIMVTGETYHQGAATDTGIVSIFNPSNQTFSNTTKFLAPGNVSNLNMRWTYAAGPNGRALYLSDPLSDIGGMNGTNRMFISFTTNFGSNWSNTMQVFYEPQNLLGEFAKPFFGLDAIYDNAGNYYIAFNTTNELGDYTSARLWVSKNGGTPVLVAQHNGLNGIPEAASTVPTAQAGICTIDHPSLSVSSDGTILYVAYSVLNQNDITNNYNKAHIYISTSLTSNLSFGPPLRVTNTGPGSFDERYVSLSQTTPDLGGPSGKTVYMVYQKDPQGGSSSFNDLAPMSRASLIFRKINDLSFPITGNNGNQGILPTKTALHQNYPNPFNPVTRISFDLNTSSKVNLSVFDASGRLSAVIFESRDFGAGTYEANFDASSLSSGVYFIRLNVQDDLGKQLILSKKMLMIK